MREKFSCFYDLTDEVALEEVWKDEKTLFIFDTNILLNLYSFNPKSRADFFKVLEKIQGRIWIPFHVGLEFQRNRLCEIKKRRSHFKKFEEKIDGLKKSVQFPEATFSSLISEFSITKNHPEIKKLLDEISEEMKKLLLPIHTMLNNNIEKLKQQVLESDTDKIFINSDDPIRETLDQLFAHKVGDNTFDSNEKINALNKEGEQRYKNEIPPGYKDKGKKASKEGNEGKSKEVDEEFIFDGLSYKNKYGDLMIFKQIIAYTKQNEIKNVIFISEEKKADWLHIEDFNGKKILGARHELKRELYKEANVNHFLIYDTGFFMDQASRYLQIEFEAKTLENIKQSLEENHQARLDEDNFDNEREQFESLQHVFEQSENIQRMLKQSESLKPALELFEDIRRMCEPYQSIKHVFEHYENMQHMLKLPESIQRAGNLLAHELESKSPYLQKDIEDEDDGN